MQETNSDHPVEVLHANESGLTIPHKQDIIL